MMLMACGAEENTVKTAMETTAETGNEEEYDPAFVVPETEEGTAKLIFDSFDGGGPEFHVIVEDESIVSHRTDTRYESADHDNMTGSGKKVVITFTGEQPGQTYVTVEERSPIADNLDRRYEVTVDDDRNVTIEELSVRDMNEVSEDMRLFINGEEVPVTWENNRSVEELRFLSPLKIRMSMYGGFEQVGALESSITREDAQITADFGDIVLYSGNQIVIFYGSNSWAYTRLGHVELTKEELTEILGNGDVEIAIE